MDAIARLLDAIHFAAQKHRNQRCRDAEATPYINHPLALARLLAVDGGVSDVELLMAAVLHDTVEDTDATIEEVGERFGERVAGLVAELTDDKCLPKLRRRELQIAHAPHKSPAAALIKLADKTCHLRDAFTAPPAQWSPQRLRDYFDGAKQVADRLPVASDSMQALFMEAYGKRP